MVTLHLPVALIHALWAHAERDAPRECVGVLGGVLDGETARAEALYPLANISGRPTTEYLADPVHLLRALKVMAADRQHLVALYHSHPLGPARPSATDARLAQYPVPYVIADLSTRTLAAFRLPGGTVVPITSG